MRTPTSRPFPPGLTFVAGSEHLPGWFAARDEVYARWFDGELVPGHSLVVVQALASPNLRVEIEGWVALAQPGA